MRAKLLLELWTNSMQTTTTCIDIPHEPFLTHTAVCSGEEEEEEEASTDAWLHELNPDSQSIVTGCMANTYLAKAKAGDRCMHILL